MLLDTVLKCLARNKLSVFLFHKVPHERDALFPNEVDCKTFGFLINFIQEYFKVIPLDDAVSRLSSGRVEDGYACITFDDGYSNWCSSVVPLLEENRLHATFFISTEQLEGKSLWHERLANIIRCSEKEILDTRSFMLQPIAIRSLAEKRLAIQTLEHHFKYLPVLLRDKYLAEFELKNNVTSRELNVFTKEHLREISVKGFGVGSHSVTHPILSLCDRKSAKYEMGEAKDVLEGIVGHKIESFAYPNGRSYIDFSNQHISLAKELGYSSAVSTEWGVATKRTSLYQIPRFTPWGPTKHRVWVQILRNLVSKPDLVDGE